MKRFGYAALVLLILLGLGQIAWQLPQLPEQVASHFNGAGQPDGYMSRTAFAGFMLSMVIGLPLFMVAMGKLTRVLPTSMINMPNKEYWLSDARRETTLNEMEGFLVWIAVATQVFFVALSHLTFVANMEKQGLSTLWTSTLIAGYLVCVFGGCGYIFWKYRLPKAVADSRVAA
ncbi:MAG: DUF1648 domain-containing protein [Planctomycetota bacterium]